jgi:methylaspartate ammonia-lyase
VAPLLVGRKLTGFRELARDVDTDGMPGQPMHTAVRYGVTQALLDAVATARRVTMAEVVRDEYNTCVALAPVPMFAQTGDERYANAEKMILKRVAAWADQHGGGQAGPSG